MIRGEPTMSTRICEPRALGNAQPECVCVCSASAGLFPADEVLFDHDGLGRGVVNLAQAGMVRASRQQHAGMVVEIGAKKLRVQPPPLLHLLHVQPDLLGAGGCVSRPPFPPLLNEQDAVRGQPTPRRDVSVHGCVFV